MSFWSKEILKKDIAKKRNHFNLRWLGIFFWRHFYWVLKETLATIRKSGKLGQSWVIKKMFIYNWSFFRTKRTSMFWNWTQAISSISRFAAIDKSMWDWVSICAQIMIHASVWFHDMWTSILDLGVLHEHWQILWMQFHSFVTCYILNAT